MKKNQLIITVVLVLSLSCQKNNNNGGDENGKINSVMQNGISLSYVYDDQGRLVSRTAPEGDASYTYTATRIIEKIEAAAGPVTLIYELNAQGLVSKSYNQDSAQFFRSYQYDGSGKLVAETYNAAGNGAIETTYHYSGTGNPDSAVSRQLNTVVQKRIFEFDTNLPNVIAADKFGISIFGKDAEHLVTKQTEINTGGVTIVQSYAYEFDNKGRVTRIIQRQQGTTQEQITDYNY